MNPVEIPIVRVNGVLVFPLTMTHLKSTPCFVYLIIVKNQFQPTRTRAVILLKLIVNSTLVRFAKGDAVFNISCISAWYLSRVRMGGITNLFISNILPLKESVATFSINSHFTFYCSSVANRDNYLSSSFKRSP